MKCPELLDKLSQYVAGELADGAQDEVAAHLQACEVCRAEAEAFRRAEKVLKTLGAVEAAPELRDDLWRRIAAPEGRRLGRILAGAAVTAAAAAIALLTYTKPGGVRPPGPVRAEVALPSIAPAKPAPPAARQATAPEASPSIAATVPKLPGVRSALARPHRRVVHQTAARPDPGIEGRRAEVTQTEQPKEAAASLPVATHEAATGVILLLGNPEPILPSSSYYAEITFPDGGKSILDQSVDRDTLGEELAVRIAYQQIAPEAGAQNEGG